MTDANWYELAVIALILCGIGWIIFRGGQANPVGTGEVGTKMVKLAQEVSKLDGRMKHLETNMQKLEQDGATTKDIKRLEELGDRTFRSVERIERIILEKGLGK